MKMLAYLKQIPPSFDFQFSEAVCKCFCDFVIQNHRSLKVPPDAHACCHHPAHPKEGYNYIQCSQPTFAEIGGITIKYKELIIQKYGDTTNAIVRMGTF